MLLITNRNIITDSKGKVSFGEQHSEKGPAEIRLAHVTTNTGKKWQIDLVDEPDLSQKENLTKEDFPSYQELKKVFQQCQDNKKHCLFYVHGYGKEFVETLEQAYRLQQKYGIEVILFSWPSNTGGIALKQYKDVKRRAFSSSTALDNIFEKIAEYLKFDFNKEKLLECELHFNLMTYSMGNYIFQKYVEESIYDGETHMFTNIILCQSDVDNQGHEIWVNKIQAGKRIYITINENDKILGWSDANFQKDRLGRTAKNLISKNAIYIDFTDGKNVKNNHQVWNLDQDNPTVSKFFQSVFRGERGETTSGLVFKPNKNSYEI